MCIRDSVKELGAVKSTHYIYIIPLVTLLTSAVIINEKITWIALTLSLIHICYAAQGTNRKSD